jgi:hypothetical protein
MCSNDNGIGSRIIRPFSWFLLRHISSILKGGHSRWHAVYLEQPGLDFNHSRLSLNMDSSTSLDALERFSSKSKELKVFCKARETRQGQLACILRCGQSFDAEEDGDVT